MARRPGADPRCRGQERDQGPEAAQAPIRGRRSRPRTGSLGDKGPKDATDGTTHERGHHQVAVVKLKRGRIPLTETPFERRPEPATGAATADTPAAGPRSPDVAALSRPAVAAPTRDAPETHQRLGDVLVGNGTITPEQLEEALLAQEDSGLRLGEALVSLGFVSEAKVAQALAAQLGLPVADLRRTVPSPEALEALPEALVRREQILPLWLDDDGLAIAVSGPLLPSTLETIRRSCGRDPRLLGAAPSDIRRSIDRAYDALTGIENLTTSFAATDQARAELAAEVLSIDDNAPVVQVVTKIVTQAVRERASDIHLEPQDTGIRIRFRVDGVLHDVASLPASMGPPLVSRLKIMADMNIVERRRAQDGQFEFAADGHALDVRVATVATLHGEKAVLRLLDKSRALLEVGKLGMAPATRHDFSQLIRSPFGMVLCAGPTGSGKTTTLYAAINEINSAERNITTIEDPVEYVIPTINQIQINQAAEMTFAGGLRAILRQDPDVILVGEIRDVETARIAVQSALTGHLVLSSVHATDSTFALHRFLDMGVESFLVASSVIGIVAQRLVRRICDVCREPYQPAPEELAWYHDAGGRTKHEFFHGAGCNFCAHTGYLDRVGVYELLRVTPEVRELVVKQAPHEEVRALAREQGLRTLKDESRRVVEEDVTTIAEVLRSIYVA